MLVCYHPYYRYLDVYYPYISLNNVIQVCSPNPLMLRDFEFLFQQFARRKDWYRTCRNSSMHILFRNKFPKIAVCCSLLPSVGSQDVLFFKFSVLINGTKQFSSSCNYIIETWNPILWCDLECKVEGMFLEKEWNETEILFEFKYATAISRTSNIAAVQSWEARGSVNWILVGIGVSEARLKEAGRNRRIRISLLGTVVKKYK
ncbi:hypothetical protein VNO78_33086 [Psophocarpus tetragonolobus]|uniref:Uncharacterized protein n=1 Tax=Psophocarpus tetragonolobus TaxID=3891 RepID=A0AAN9P0H2_PSOTE